MTITSLFRRYEQLCRQQVEIEAAVADVRRQIQVAMKGAAPKKRGRSRRGTETPEMIRSVVKVLQESEEPMARQEIASRLGISGSATGFRLAQAAKQGYVHKIGRGRYACAPEVPTL